MSVEEKVITKEEVVVRGILNQFDGEQISESKIYEFFDYLIKDDPDYNLRGLTSALYYVAQIEELKLKGGNYNLGSKNKIVTISDGALETFKSSSLYEKHFNLS